jgi:subtilisin family serine protease
MLEFARDSGALVIVAAGNDSCTIGGACGVSGRDFQRTYYYPCSYDHVICVAASTHQDELAGFSNRAQSVGLTAPGWGIFTTASANGAANGYAYVNGTSAAAPMVTSAAAVLWSLFPELDAQSVKTILQKSAAQIPGIQDQMTSRDGRLDLHAALAFARSLRASGTTADAGTPPEIATEPSIAAHAPEVGGDPAAASPKAFGGGGDGGGGGGGHKSKVSVPGCGTVSGQPSATVAGLILLLAALAAPLLAALRPLKSLAKSTRTRSRGARITKA